MGGAMFSGLESPLHWLVLLVVVLLLFGPRRLPELGRSLGSGMRAFRDGIAGTGESDAEAAAAPATATVSERVDTPPDSPA
jgi:sec-independent protein translocase protein TatA